MKNVVLEMMVTSGWKGQEEEGARRAPYSSMCVRVKGP